MPDREAIRREVTQEVIDYIDGDPENGPRHGVDVTEHDIEDEVDRRFENAVIVEFLGALEDAVGRHDVGTALVIISQIRRIVESPVVRGGMLYS